ncbi:MAG: AAA family ATPase, partial [Rectinemataceae bacterium]|nr:AAA family ATPase [Rectinemataceae bacterium]
MKILEISGCNLASLKGEFCIALDKAPFTRDGLFAIRGVTGSGKSTLIDAMCLALYDDTPRFVGRGGPRVGLADQDDKDRVSATDPKSILQRGAWQGWAQVVFRGVDGHRWRAKWSVARARKKAEGRLQDQEMELEDLETNERTTGHKKDVLKAIESKVGLTFEQFRRSVLLAQGEFAAFAKADQDERAALLEAMTGTGIYAKVSMAAQKRSVLEEQKLKDLNTERIALGLLSEDARIEKDGEASSLTAQIEQEEKAQAEVAKGLGWYERCSELESQRFEAAKNVESTEVVFTQSEARRNLLRDVDSAQFLHPIRANVSNLQDRHVSLGKQITTYSADLPSSEKAKQEGFDLLQGKQKILTEAAAAIEAAKPDLDAARTLDTRIQEVQTQLRTASEVAATLRREALLAQQARDASINDEKRLMEQFSTVEHELE